MITSIIIITILVAFFTIRSRRKMLEQLKTYQIRLSNNHISELYRGGYVKSVHYTMIDDYYINNDVLVVNAKAPDKSKYYFNLNVDDKEVLVRELDERLRS